MKNQNQELLKIAKKESKILSNYMLLDDQDQLIFKVTNRDFKDALKIDPDTKQPTDHFNETYKQRLNEIRKYNVVDAESFKLVFDEKCDKNKKQLYLIAWNRFFATSIIKQNKDHKNIKRKMVWYLITGILAILIFTGIQVCGVIYSDKIPAIKIVAVCFEFLLILAWVLVWNFFDALLEDLPNSRAKLVDLYLMYKGNGELSKTDIKSIPAPIPQIDPVQLELEKINKEISNLKTKCKLSDDPKTIQDPIVKGQLIKVKKLIENWNKVTVKKPATAQILKSTIDQNKKEAVK